ncbi:hypothetical protein K2173_007588 [Erythroxylum novogranatense]|uniref:Uncharacterized protein n=1 Tax=Erythroxylum novogranatense TaxID=1862640 RepID=A0AAV8S982_9ROSI|nr:hypothetical protein K2173_007588 [Erythroxylum novogranatense]
MNGQVQIVSQTIAKPSSPTPNHLRHLQLSSLDQIMVPIFVPWQVFYPNSPGISNAERCERLRKSLSDTLTLFYPLAGRVRQHSHIDCNDEGVPFVEAKAKSTIVEVLQSMHCNKFKELIPFQVQHDSDLCSFVQVTHFECGGIVIGVGLSHKIADAVSDVTFFNSWAAIARGERNNVLVPKFEAAKHFPPIDISDFDPCFEVVKDNRKIVSKRFVFDATSIKKLRDKYTENYCSPTGNMIKPPTRVEVLTAFICSRVMAATQLRADNSDTVYMVKHALDFRRRMDPPLSKQHIGNITFEPVVAETQIDTEDKYCYGVINQMRRTLTSADTDYVKKFQEGDEQLNLMKDRAERQRYKKVVSLSFTSFCWFPVYEIDFGWGKPEWIGSACWPYQNMFLFTDTKEKGGIEMNANLLEEDMANFEKDVELAAIFISQLSNPF